MDNRLAAGQNVAAMNLFMFSTRRNLPRLVLVSLLLLPLSACRSPAQRESATTDHFSFLAAGDMRGYVKAKSNDERYFDGLCEAARRVGAGTFMVTPGDFDPPAPVRTALDEYLGTNYLWYPVVGNHEIETPEDMAWVKAWAARGIPHLVRLGPPGAELTTYSFDYGNSHFVAVNDYFDNHTDVKSKGAIAEATLTWLENDFASTKKPSVWVIGHIPIESLPDMDTGRVRHQGETVSTNSAAAARFVGLLQKYRVRAYLCGHTHNTSVAKVRGIWQADSGHARGAGDKGSPSTFMKFRVAGEKAWVDVYRSNTNGIDYTLRKTVELN